MGQVVPSVLTPNVAREVSLLPQFPRTIPAYTLNRACASAAQAITNAADQIRLGHADVILAGGVESLSDIPVLHSRRFSRLLVEASKAKTLGQRLGIFAQVRPRDLVPVTPAIAEPSTGESMGQSAEKMAKENGITRDAQDRLALQSHERAAAGTADGRLTAEIAPWFGGKGGDEVVTSDNGIRSDTSLEQLARLRPVFDRTYGTVTAGNSSPLTDGAAMVLLMSEERARSLGYEPLAFLRSYAVAAVDPGWQLLMGPAYAVPKALERAGISWGDLGPGGDPRGVCGAGALERPGLGFNHLGRATRAAGTGRRRGLGAHQRHGWFDRDRSSVRCHRRAHRDHARQRDAPARRAVRADLHLRTGRHGQRARAREAVSMSCLQG